MTTRLNSKLVLHPRDMYQRLDIGDMRQGKYPVAIDQLILRQNPRQHRQAHRERS